ncbi:CoA-binding protein [bacterium]|nr:CoA-binding protein [bacterium]
MKKRDELEVFLNPGSVAVIGATQRPSSWGAMIMKGLLSSGYPGKIYPVSQKNTRVYDIPAYRDIRDIPGPVDLAVFTIPEASVEKVLAACGEKKVKGISLVTAGFGEIFDDREGINKEKKLVALAKSFGIAILGPNISGTFNLHAGFNASAGIADHICPTRLGAICQGGFAFYDLLESGRYQGQGVGKFVHTGNECDLTVTDFLAHFYHDPDIDGILMYLETVRDGSRFREVMRDLTRKKPVVVFKAGLTPGSARAARSHTGALSGRKEVFEGALDQLGVIMSPTMELLLPLGHALTERPLMRGRRVGIITVGGSWGVILSGFIEQEGLLVPELGQTLQKALKSLGMPPRASTRNPVDIGASGLGFPMENLIEMARAIITSGEVDALVLHGFGNSGMIDDRSSSEERFFNDYSKQIMLLFHGLQKEYDFPVILASHHTHWESQVISDLNQQGIRMLNRIDETARILSLMHDYYRKRLASAR